MIQIHRFALLLGCGLALCVSGCILSRGYYDRPIDISKVESIEPGVTTKEQVLALLGPPTEIEARDIVNVQTLVTEESVRRMTSSRYFKYSYGRANVAGLILVVFNYADFDVKFDTAMIFFDDNDVVQYVSYVDDTQNLPRFGPLSR